MRNADPIRLKRRENYTLHGHGPSKMVKQQCPTGPGEHEQLNIKKNPRY